MKELLIRIGIKILFLTILQGNISCSKSQIKEDNDLQTNTPHSKIPAELSSKVWFSGTLSAISHFDRDGHQLGNDYEAGREFQFYEDEKGRGRVKFWQYLGMRNFSGCITEIYTYKEGTVVFEGPLFTFYPTKGNFRTVKDKCGTANGTTRRDAKAEDLQPTSYRWEIKDSDGEILLYTYDKDDTQHDNVLFVYAIAE